MAGHSDTDWQWQHTRITYCACAGGKPLNSSRWRGGRLDGAEGAISTEQKTCLY